MEYLPFLIILIIVIATGYILSKPFTRTTEGSTEESKITPQKQYQNLLLEIKALQKVCETGAVSKVDCIDQIKEKKKMAADLLRKSDLAQESDEQSTG